MAVETALATVERGGTDGDKRCPDCQRSFPATAEYFHRRGDGGRLNTYCKQCASGRARAHYAANREHHLALTALWRSEHTEELRAYFAQRRLGNAERERDEDRRYRQAHADSIRRTKREYYERNKDAFVARARRWASANPEKANLYAIRKSHRRRGVEPDRETRAFIPVLLADPCPYCGAPSEVIDHIVPVSRGGVGHWSNLTGACRSCNAAKSNKSLLTFLVGRSA